MKIYRILMSPRIRSARYTLVTHVTLSATDVTHYFANSVSRRDTHVRNLARIQGRQATYSLLWLSKSYQSALLKALWMSSRVMNLFLSIKCWYQEQALKYSITCDIYTPRAQTACYCRQMESSRWPVPHVHSSRWAFSLYRIDRCYQNRRVYNAFIFLVLCLQVLEQVRILPHWWYCIYHTLQTTRSFFNRHIFTVTFKQ